MPHIRALDGVRALAVTAVLVYHLGWDRLPGGYLGVDVFFVLSGFLITTLLISERTATGTVSLSRFYFRRGRRLLPALFAVILVTVTYCAIFLPEELARLRGDVVAAFFYVTNWFLVFQQESYFQALGRPDLLRHLWSLAVEEQFYLLWPILLLVLLGTAAKMRTTTALRWTLAGVAASTVLMAVLYDPFGDPSRSYYGTDTHAAALLVGAALALVWQPWESADRAAKGAPTVLDVVGLGALAVLVIFFLTARDTSPLMYRGGFLVAALAATALIAVVVHPSARLVPRAFGLGALVWIGLRSYAIYLWHWPVFMVTRPEDVGFDGLTLAVLRLAVTVLLAALSFRFLENPVRRGALGRWWRGLGADPSSRTLAVAGTGATVLVAVISVVVGVTATSLIMAQPSVSADVAVDTGATPEIALSPAAPAPPSAPASGQPDKTAKPFKTPIRVGLFGDSTGMTLALNEPAGLSRYLTISDQTVEGCSVIQARITSSTGFRRDLGAECSNWKQRWKDKAAALAPKIALVNLGAWDVFDLEVDGKKMPFGSPEWDAYYSQQLRAGIDVLLASGAQVALSEVPCFRPVKAGGLPKLPERGMDDRTSHLNALFQEVAQDYPGQVFVVSPPAEFCKDKTIANSLSYRWDGTHYYKPGAKLYFDVVTPQLLAIPRPG